MDTFLFMPISFDTDAPIVELTRFGTAATSTNIFTRKEPMGKNVFPFKSSSVQGLGGTLVLQNPRFYDLCWKLQVASGFTSS